MQNKTTRALTERRWKLTYTHIKAQCWQQKQTLKSHRILFILPYNVNLEQRTSNSPTTQKRSRDIHDPTSQELSNTFAQAIDSGTTRNSSI